MILKLDIEEANMFLYRISLLVITFFVGYSGYVEARGSVSVKGYTRKDGTYVAPHYRSAPDGNFNNNWSTAGNINPYTGKEGTLTSPSSSSTPQVTSTPTPQVTSTPTPQVTSTPVKSETKYSKNSSQESSKNKVCVIKPVMADEDYYACGITPPGGVSLYSADSE